MRQVSSSGMVSSLVQLIRWGGRVWTSPRGDAQVGVLATNLLDGAVEHQLGLLGGEECKTVAWTRLVSWLRSRA